MIFYTTCGSLFSVYIEVNKELGFSPIYLIQRYKTEHIIHLPYTEIIYTPNGKILNKRAKTNEKRNEFFQNNITRITKY